MAEPFEVLMGLYKPRIGGGNFQPDVFTRGANQMLVKAAVALGVATEEQMTAGFKVLDDAYDQRVEAAIARAEARDA